MLIKLADYKMDSTFVPNYTRQKQLDPVTTILCSTFASKMAQSSFTGSRHLGLVAAAQHDAPSLDRNHLRPRSDRSLLPVSALCPLQYSKKKLPNSTFNVFKMHNKVIFLLLFQYLPSRSLNYPLNLHLFVFYSN